MNTNSVSDLKQPYIVGVGGANMDIHARLRGPLVMRDSNPGIFGTTAGGVARNVLDNACRLGISCVLLSAVGNDPFGSSVLDSCRSVGMDTSHVLISEDFSTGCYLALIDDSGDMAVAANDTRIVENIPLPYFEENEALIRNASAVFCDPNLTRNQILKLKEISGDVKLFLDPVSTIKAERIKDILGSFYFIKPNLMELEYLSGIDCRTDSDIERASDKLLQSGLYSICVSLGEKGCFYKDLDGNRFFRSLKRKIELADATGAGDAFMAGMMAAYIKKYSVEKCLDYALCAGAAAAMSESTINPELSEEYILTFL